MKLLPPSDGLTLDTGALIGILRASTRVRMILAEARRLSWRIFIPAGVVAQAWRGGPRAARLAQFLRSSDVTIVPLTELSARKVGELCSKAGHSDVVDASVVICARKYGRVAVTSDPGDLIKFDETIELLTV